MNQVGLVLEGGGMRGVYSAGVMEYFLEKDVNFPYVIGVSAGACNAASYLSKQKGRNRKVNIDFISDPRYLSWQNYFKHRQLFGMDFIFDEIPNRIVPFDYSAFFNNPSEFVIGTTDCHSGEPVYFTKSQYGKNVLPILKASSSLPFVAPEIEYDNKVLLDGGISDPIPIQKAEKDGYKKNVVILTRNEDYRKSPSRFHYFVNRRYAHYPGLVAAMKNRYQIYNETLQYIIEQQKKDNVFILRPQQPLKVGRMERDPKKLSQLFEQGYMDAKNSYDDLKIWIQK
ncbi:patatin-like phospholipase family protein [Neobacillus sp. D3-1R]|uniref:patatin-like phospholipase family protein n=1 Tax=Neobacillus sp. D3-1R TaxID=3445778 RepID=UPI003FA04292